MRRLTFILTLMLLMGISLLTALNYDSDWFYPNTIMTCFKMESIGRFDGKIEFTKDGEVVHTNMDSFNQLAKEYGIVDLKQAHEFVKKPTWNEEGRYLQCVYRVMLADDKQMDAALQAIAKDPNVLYAEFETINRSYLTPNDPLITQQYALSVMRCYEAWDYVTGSEDVVVAITDTGVKWNHPDLRENIWINPLEAPGMTINWDAGTYSGANGVDNDGNGKVDDLMGWDFYSSDNNPYQNYVQNDHGTHVAGCVGAVFNNGIGGSGSSPIVSIMCCKGSSNTSPSTGIMYGYDMIKYAAESGADVINASWGGQATSLNYPNSIVNYAVNLGSLFVAAAGNNNTEHGAGYMDAPADCTNALCVAATTESDMKADFSDFGAPIDICAPGVGILSTIIAGDGYAAYDGTSMASPLTAGVAALVKAVNPELTPLQLKQRLMDTADWIYDTNPTFADPPMLGAGRVNAFAATMYDKIPYLTIDDMAVTELDGDGDGITNPGELIQLNLQLSNLMDPNTGLMWTTAENVIAKLRCDMPGVVVIDSVASYGVLGSGASNWNTNDPFTFQTVTSLPSVPIPFSLYLTANPTAEYSYTVTRNFDINLSLVHAGWPINLNGASQSSACLVNIDGSPDLEVIFGDQAGHIHAMKSNGTELTGFPYVAAGGIIGALAMADINADGNQEIVANVSPSSIICISETGQLLWTAPSGGTLVGNPIIANLNMTGTPEIISFTQNKYVVVLKADGAAYPNFPVLLEGAMLAPGAVGDLNMDGQLDIVVATLTGKLHAINSSTGLEMANFPVALGSASRNQPTIANLDGDAQPEILIPTYSNGQLFAINHDGSTLFQKNIGQQIKGGAVVADINNNGSQEIVIVAYNGDLYVTDTAGINLPGFPVSVGQNVESTPVIARFDGSNLSGIVFGDANGKLHSYRSDGTESANFPITINGNVKVSAALADIDNDSKMDIAVPNDASFFIIDTKRAAASYQWQFFMGNNSRSGNTYQTTPNTDNTIPELTTALTGNYPNPFNPETTISFTVKAATPVIVEIYNTKGQKVKTLVNETKAQGNHTINWNGTDDKGTKVSGGVYLYRMNAGKYTSTKKMIMMK
jgi:serine protease